MLSLAEIAELEDNGYENAALQPAYDALLDRWREAPDRETGLRLLFLAWLASADPPFVTGIEESDEHLRMATEVMGELERALGYDPEFLVVCTFMLSAAPWGFWLTERKARKRIRSNRRALKRRGGVVPPPDLFAGRGAYGAYFGTVDLSGVLSD